VNARKPTDALRNVVRALVVNPPYDHDDSTRLQHEARLLLPTALVRTAEPEDRDELMAVSLTLLELDAVVA
jgi:hypothetical protein